MNEAAHLALKSGNVGWPLHAGPHGARNRFLAECPGHFQEPGPQRLGSILVPVDFRESSRKAASLACRLAAKFGASIVLVHVVDSDSVGALLGSVTRRRVRAEAHDWAQRNLAAIMKMHETNRVPTKWVIRDGIPQFEIVRLAQALKTGLIVLGRSRRGVFSRLLLGSVTGGVIEFSPCPVLVVPE